MDIQLSTEDQALAEWIRDRNGLYDVASVVRFAIRRTARQLTAEDALSHAARPTAGGDAGGAER